MDQHLTDKNIYPSWPWFNIKMSSYQYKKSHCGGKTVVRSSYLHNGISYTGKISSLYWIRALMSTHNGISFKVKSSRNSLISCKHCISSILMWKAQAETFARPMSCICVSLNFLLRRPSISRQSRSIRCLTLVLFVVHTIYHDIVLIGCRGCRPPQGWISRTHIVWWYPFSMYYMWVYAPVQKKPAHVLN